VEFEKSDTINYVLQEPTVKEINDMVNALTKQVATFAKNKPNPLRTFIVLFYTGHGAMRNNE